MERNGQIAPKRREQAQKIEQIKTTYRSKSHWREIPKKEKESIIRCHQNISRQGPRIESERRSYSHLLARSREAILQFKIASYLHNQIREIYNIRLKIIDQ